MLTFTVDGRTMRVRITGTVDERVQGQQLLGEVTETSEVVMPIEPAPDGVCPAEPTPTPKPTPAPTEEPDLPDTSTPPPFIDEATPPPAPIQSIDVVFAPPVTGSSPSPSAPPGRLGRAMNRRALAAGVALASLLSVGGVAAQGASPEASRGATIVPGTTVTGSIDAYAERDAYALTIDPTEPASLLDIRLIAPAGPARRVCVEKPRSRRASTPPPSSRVPVARAAPCCATCSLRPARTRSIVDGEAAPDIYALIVDQTSAPLADHEAEPNDVPTLATPWDASLVLQAWHEAYDVDHYALRTTGEPQRWRLEVAGEGIVGFQQVRATGAQLAAAAPDTGRTTWVFPDVYLGPGDHLLRIDGSGVGAYTLTATPLGPPDPDGELEPNDVDPEPLPVGTTRSGMLASSSDQDQYRFSLSAEERIRIRVEPPADGGAYVTLGSSTEALATGASEAPGGAFELDQVLQPDDYVIRVAATYPSAERYRISLTREDPFAADSTAELSVELALRTDGPIQQRSGRGAGVARDAVDREHRDHGPRPVPRCADERPPMDSDDLGRGAVAWRREPPSRPGDDRGPRGRDRVPVRATIRAREATGAQRTAFLEITPAARRATRWGTPCVVRARRVAGWRRRRRRHAGSEPIVSIQEPGELALHDGAAPTLGGMDLPGRPPVAFTVDLAGDEPLPVVGMLLIRSPTGGPMTGVPRDVELLLSEDGTIWQPALAGVLSPAPFEQSFVLSAPMNARYAQLRITSTWGQPGTLQLGEWKVVATPGACLPASPSTSPTRRSVATSPWMDPQPCSQATSRPPSMATPSGCRTGCPSTGRTGGSTWVVAFQDDRAARVTSLGLGGRRGFGPGRSVPVGRRWPSARSGPDGPWQDARDLAARRGRDGCVARVRARRRAVGAGDPLPGAPSRSGAQAVVELPARIHAFERPPDATLSARSRGSGAMGSPRGRGSGPGRAATTTGIPPDAGNHTAESAIPIDRDGSPEGASSATWSTTGTSVSIPRASTPCGSSSAASRSWVPRSSSRRRMARSCRWPAIGCHRPGLELSASVEPGVTYLVRVHQPGLGRHLARHEREHRSHARDPGPRRVRPGHRGGWRVRPAAAIRERAAARGWSDDRWEVSDGLAGLIPSGSSAVEATLIDAADSSRPVRGPARPAAHRCETSRSSFGRRRGRTCGRSGPVIFPVHVPGPSRRASTAS